jgi:hypothetical protein
VRIAAVGKSRSALEIWQNVRVGILRNVSIGYVVKSTEPDSDRVRVTDWETLEASLVAIPVDPTVEANRTRTMEQEIEEIVSNDGVAAERQRVREITTLGKRQDQKKWPPRQTITACC